MIIKNYILYIQKKKKITKLFCKECLICIKICPFNIIVKKKNFFLNNCKICNFCTLLCPSKCIK